MDVPENVLWRSSDRPWRPPTPPSPVQVVHLMSSKLSLLMLGNEALVLTLIFGQLCKRIFFGRLRDAEVESLYERSWFAITETCLAMTIFREEFNFRFVALFSALFFLKIFLCSVARACARSDEARRGVPAK